MTLLAKVLPLQLSGAGGGALVIRWERDAPDGTESWSRDRARAEPRSQSRNRRKPRSENQPVANDGYRIRLPGLGVSGKPPLAAFPVGDLGWVLAENHPVEAFLTCPRVAHSALPCPLVDRRQAQGS